MAKKLPPKVPAKEFSPPSDGTIIAESLLSFDEMRKKIEGKTFFETFKDSQEEE